LPGLFGVCDHIQKLNLATVAEEMKKILSYHSFMKTEAKSAPGMIMGKISLGLKSVDDSVHQIEGLILAWHGKILNSDHNSRIPECAEPAQLYRKHGFDFISRLKGSFAVAIWDEKSKTLILGTDRFGTRPLYYFRNSDHFSFCSEIKGFLALPGFAPKINYTALAEFLTFGFLFENKTLLEDVALVPPGSVLVFSPDRFEIRRYWKARFSRVIPGFNRKSAIEECHSLLERAVQNDLEGSEAVGLFLSGGLDSRLLAGLAAENGRKIETFTFGTQESMDHHLAGRIANSLGLANTFYRLSPDYLARWGERGIWYTEGMSNCLNFAGIEVLPEVRQGTTRVMNGFGGNEFLGFLSGNLAKFYYRGKLDSLAEHFFPSLATLFDLKEQAGLLSAEVYRKVQGQAFDSLKEALGHGQEESPFLRLYNFMLTQKARRLNLLGIIMDHSHLEYLIPFYDYDWTEFALRLPEKERLWARFYRYFLSEKFPVLSRIPYQRTGLPVNANLMSILGNKLARKVGLDLSDRCLRGKTASYVEYPHWTRTELKSFILEILNPANLSTRDLLNPRYVQELLNHHFAGAVDNSSKIGLLLTFELWHRQFVGRKFPG
jgi:asparagine synthase (glutamine-hydrolysing)